jgi:HJR/Mrr/RecB family endonuclease
LSNEEVEVKEDEKKEKPQKTFVKSVLEFQNKLRFYEKIILSLVVANILFAFTVMFSVFSAPLVIMEKDAEKLSFQGIRKEVTITEKEIKKLVESFIRRRYEWDKFSIPR